MSFDDVVRIVDGLRAPNRCVLVVTLPGVSVMHGTPRPLFSRSHLPQLTEKSVRAG